MARELYAAQISLLVRLLPYIAPEEVFALKGGTAINLFYRDMPRLSVDIDLTYLPVRDRAESLADINETLDRVMASAIGGIQGLEARRIDGGGGGATRIRTRLNVRFQGHIIQRKEAIRERQRHDSEKQEEAQEPLDCTA